MVKIYIRILRNIYMSSKKEEQKTTTTTVTSSPSTTASTASPSQQLQEQHHLVSRSLDETRDNIRRSIDESRSQIPRYTQAVSDYQEQTIQAAREIADNYVESQKQIINSFQSVLTPYGENVNDITANWATLFSPRRVSEVYANIVSNFANNVITATRVTNNMIFGNMEAFKTSLQQAKDSAKEFSRIGVNVAKTFEQTSSDNNNATRLSSRANTL
jgi:2',3'-cyclic-nucleotide 2'-phosphodiesterase (5'-nucleotidase family)